MVLKRIVKPKNQRVKRALAKRDPQVHENDKNAMFIKGGKTSERVAKVLKELYLLKKPLTTQYRKKNIMRPLDDATSVEFFANKSDSSLFLFGSHSKKRPHNLVLGRLFDYHILDMIELGIEDFKSMEEFAISKCPLGTKPMLIFAGEAFEQDDEHKRLKSLLLDFFRGAKASHIRLSGLEHVLMFTAVDAKIYLRSYKTVMKKSGSKVPRIELEEMGPFLDLVIRRSKLASDDLYKRARRQPKQAKPKKVKNISRDPFGTQEGRIHMQKQDLGKMQTRKVKALKRRADGDDEEAAGKSDSSPKKTKDSESDVDEDEQ